MVKFKEVYICVVLPENFQNDDKNKELVLALGKLMLDPIGKLKVNINSMNTPTLLDKMRDDVQQAATVPSGIYNMTIAGVETISFTFVESLIKMLGDASLDEATGRVYDSESDSNFYYSASKGRMARTHDKITMTTYVISNKEIMEECGEHLPMPGEMFRCEKVVEMLPLCTLPIYTESRLAIANRQWVIKTIRRSA